MAEEIRENSNFIHDFIDKDLEDGVYPVFGNRCCVLHGCRLGQARTCTENSIVDFVATTE